jgi:hypothetical protein
MCHTQVASLMARGEDEFPLINTIDVLAEAALPCPLGRPGMNFSSLIFS